MRWPQGRRLGTDRLPIVQDYAITRSFCPGRTQVPASFRFTYLLANRRAGRATTMHGDSWGPEAARVSLLRPGVHSPPPVCLAS